MRVSLGYVGDKDRTCTHEWIIVGKERARPDPLSRLNLQKHSWGRDCNQVTCKKRCSNLKQTWLLQIGSSRVHKSISGGESCVYLNTLKLFCLQDITGWGENDRGVSYTFGGDVVRHFLKRNDLSLIVRAHQVRITKRLSLQQDNYPFWVWSRAIKDRSKGYSYTGHYPAVKTMRQTFDSIHKNLYLYFFLTN